MATTSSEIVGACIGLALMLGVLAGIGAFWYMVFSLGWAAIQALQAVG
jgi:hypothetical protein